MLQMDNLINSVKTVILNIFAFAALLVVFLLVFKVGFAVMKLFAAFVAIIIAGSVVVKVGLKLTDATRRFSEKMKVYFHAFD